MTPISPFTCVLVLAAFVMVSLGDTVGSCAPFSQFGLSGCPYAAPSTSDLYALIDQYCEGSYCEEVLDEGPCYDQAYFPHETSDGKSYYELSVDDGYPDPPGPNNQAECYASFDAIVNSCNEQYGEYGWYEGYLDVNGRPYAVLTCAME